MLKKMLVIFITAAICLSPLKAIETSSTINSILIKLVEIDSKIDEAIIKNDIKIIESLNITSLKNDIENLMLKDNINEKDAKSIWMYCGKIYIKINKYLSANLKNFRLAPSDFSSDPSKIRQDFKKTFMASKWLYLSSNKSKR